MAYHLLDLASLDEIFSDSKKSYMCKHATGSGTIESKLELKCGIILATCRSNENRFYGWTSSAEYKVLILVPYCICTRTHVILLYHAQMRTRYLVPSTAAPGTIVRGFWYRE